MAEVSGSADAGNPAGTGANAGTAGGAGQASSGHWTDSIPADIKPMFQSKGWDKEADPAAALLKVAPSYAQLEAKIGAKGVILPGEKAKPEDWDRFYNELGRPKAPDGYQLPGDVKIEDAEFEKWSRQTSHKLGLTEKQFASLVSEFGGFTSARAQAAEQTSQERLASAEKDLRAEWGAAFDAKLEAANRAAQALGLKPQQLSAMARAVGIQEVNRLFAQLHENYRIGALSQDERGGMAGLNTMNGGLLSPTEARARIDALIQDKEFSQKYLNGDIDAVEKMNRLHQLAAA